MDYIYDYVLLVIENGEQYDDDDNIYALLVSNRQLPFLIQ